MNPRTFSLLMIFLTFAFKLYSQSIVVGDSLKISFEYSKTTKIVNAQSDLDFAIVQTNISQRPIMVYTWLRYLRSPNVFGNVDCEVEKEESGKYYNDLDSNRGHHDFIYFYDSLSAIYGSMRLTDSVVRRFDLPKTRIEPRQSVTLKDNLLQSLIVLEPGNYRFRVLFRKAVIMKYDKDQGERIKIEYLKSDWFYFTVPKKIYDSSVHINKM